MITRRKKNKDKWITVYDFIPENEVVETLIKPKKATKKKSPKKTK